MPTFIDIRDNERHWDGETGVEVLDKDSLDGCDMALRLGDVELVLSICQAITLFDQLDGFVNGGPAHTTGAIRRRVLAAIEEMLADHQVRLTRKSQEIMSSDGFAHIFSDYLRQHGLRYRIAGEPEYEDHIARRARRAAAQRDPLNPSRATPTTGDGGEPSPLK